jgi:hypothetical protein
MLTAGLLMPSVSSLLGQTSISRTVDLYGHTHPRPEGRR